MLTELDPRVSAHLNLDAVLGTLPLLAELVPEAEKLLLPLAKPVTVQFVVRGGPRGAYTFDRTGIRSGGGGSQTRLLFASSGHFNRVIDGQAQPVPLGGPAGLRFLAKVFTPLSEILGRYLEPGEEDLRDPVFRVQSARLRLRVVVAAIVVVGNQDRSGRFSAAQMPDGRLDLEAGDDLRHQLDVRDHHLTLLGEPAGPPHAVLRFSDLETAGQVLSGELSAVSAMSEGRIAMRGLIPMVDNVNRILDRAAQYLQK
jgi:hypothetical protein